jgi:hypothetical protein
VTVTPGNLTADAPASLRYRVRTGAEKQAHLQWEAAQYEVSWGRQTFDGPHMRVRNPAGDYGVELHTFFRTHRAVPERSHHYVKVVTVRAWCVTEAAVIETYVNGRLEMTASVPAGAYVVENHDGERYAMSAEEFFSRYELDSEPEQGQ